MNQPSHKTVAMPAITCETMPLMLRLPDYAAAAIAGKQ
jgi:hypothetical protein